MSQSRWKHSRSILIRAILVSTRKQTNRPDLNGRHEYSFIFALRGKHPVTCHDRQELGLSPSHPIPHALAQIYASASRSPGCGYINRICQQLFGSPRSLLLTLKDYCVVYISTGINDCLLHNYATCYWLRLLVRQGPDGLGLPRLRLSIYAGVESSQLWRFPASPSGQSLEPEHHSVDHSSHRCLGHSKLIVRLLWIIMNLTISHVSPGLRIQIRDCRRLAPGGPMSLVM